MARPRHTCAALAFSCAVALAAPAGAGAAATCSYDSTTKTVTVGGTPSIFLRLSVGGGGAIEPREGSPQTLVPCTGSPTTTNTDTINVTASTGIGIDGPEDFTPGATAEPDGANEIEITLDTQGGSRVVAFADLADATANDWTLGAAAFDWNPGTGTPDADVTFAGDLSALMQTGAGDDRATGQGSAPTGGPYLKPLSLDSTLGKDKLTGGSGPDLITGWGTGKKILNGMAGDDEVDGGPGPNDVLLGGEGVDKLRAKDGKADKKIDCGGGKDKSAAHDARKDPKPKSC